MGIYKNQMIDAEPEEEPPTKYETGKNDEMNGLKIRWKLMQSIREAVRLLGYAPVAELCKKELDFERFLQKAKKESPQRG